MRINRTLCFSCLCFALLRCEVSSFHSSLQSQSLSSRTSSRLDHHTAGVVRIQVIVQVPDGSSKLNADRTSSNPEETARGCSRFHGVYISSRVVTPVLSILMSLKATNTEGDSPDLTPESGKSWSLSSVPRKAANAFKGTIGKSFIITKNAVNSVKSSKIPSHVSNAVQASLKKGKSLKTHTARLFSSSRMPACLCNALQKKISKNKDISYNSLAPSVSIPPTVLEDHVITDSNALLEAKVVSTESLDDNLVLKSEAEEILTETPIDPAAIMNIALVTDTVTESPLIVPVPSECEESTEVYSVSEKIEENENLDSVSENVVAEIATNTTVLDIDVNIVNEASDKEVEPAGEDEPKDSAVLVDEAEVLVKFETPALSTEPPEELTAENNETLLDVIAMPDTNSVLSEEIVDDLTVVDDGIIETVTNTILTSSKGVEIVQDDDKEVRNSIMLEITTNVSASNNDDLEDPIDEDLLSYTKTRIKNFFRKTSITQQTPASSPTTLPAMSTFDDSIKSGAKSVSAILENIQEAPALAVSSLSGPISKVVKKTTPSFFRDAYKVGKALKGFQFDQRQQPLPPEIELRLQAKYAAIESLEERAFQILVDLRMVEIHSPTDLDAAGEWE